MGIYVDSLRRLSRAQRRKIPERHHGKLWCHLVADSERELHEFAESIGLGRFAFHERAVIPHYDITEQMRTKALEAGAHDIDPASLNEMLRSMLAARRGGA